MSTVQARCFARRLAAAGAAVLALAAAACGGGAPEAPAAGAYLRYRMPQDPPTLDPHDANDESSNLYVYNIFDGLVEFAPGSLKVAPAVAVSWDVSDDHLTWTFHLRPGVKFHNGREVTASDVVYSLQRALEAGRRAAPREALLVIQGARAFAGGKADHVSGLSAPDARTVVIRLERPSATLLTALATQAGSIVPHEVYDDPGKKYLQHPVGCGPFSFESWEHGREIRLAAFHDHWKGPPGIAGIAVRIIPDVTTALLEYRTGGLEIDNEVPSGQRRKVSEEMGSQYRVRPRISTSYILLNQATGPFSESRDLRLAVNWAVDRDRIAKVLQEGKDQASSWILPPDLAGGRTTPGPFGYDPEKAKTLLAGAGFPGGKGLPPLTLLSPDNESIRRYAESVQNDLREIGLNVKLEALDFNAYYEALFGSPGKGPKADMAVLIWFADYPDPEAVLRQLFRSDSTMNFGRYHNDEVDRLLDQADAETDPSRRQEIFLEAEKVLLDDGAIVPLHHQGDDLLVKPYVTGIVQSPLGDFAVPLELAGMSR